MRLGDIKDRYVDYARKLQDIVRQLAMAGIAIVWVLGVGTERNSPERELLLLATTGFVLSLAFDLIWYWRAQCIEGAQYARAETWAFREASKSGKPLSDGLVPDYKLEVPGYDGDSHNQLHVILRLKLWSALIGFLLVLACLACRIP